MSSGDNAKNELTSTHLPSAEIAVGDSVPEVAGKVVGNEKLEAEGKVDKAAGKTQATYGDVKEDVKDAVSALHQHITAIVDRIDGEARAAMARLQSLYRADT